MEEKLEEHGSGIMMLRTVLMKTVDVGKKKTRENK